MTSSHVAEGTSHTPVVHRLADLVTTSSSAVLFSFLSELWSAGTNSPWTGGCPEMFGPRALSLLVQPLPAGRFEHLAVRQEFLVSYTNAVDPRPDGRIGVSRQTLIPGTIFFNNLLINVKQIGVGVAVYWCGG